MRLLPRSAKGTWLLATAVWAALCALTWRSLPVRPRVTAKVPEFSYLLGVAPSGRTIAFKTLINGGDGSGRVSLYDSATSSIRVVFPNLEIVGRWAFSPDGRWLAFDGPPDKRGVHLIDLSSGVDTVLGHEGTTIPGYGLESFSPDSHLLAVAENRSDSPPGVQLWDMDRRQPAKFLPGECLRATFSPDGRRLVVKLFVDHPADDRTERYVIWDTATGRELARLNVPWCASVATFTFDGTGLVTFDHSPSADGIPQSCACMNIADGRVRWSFDNIGRCEAVDGGKRVMTMRIDPLTAAEEIVILDSTDGHIVSRAPFGADWGLSDFGPDGLTWVKNSRGYLGTDAWWNWLAGCGLPIQYRLERPYFDLCVAATGQRILTIREPDNSSLQYAANGKTFAILSEAGDLTVWDIPPRKPLTSFALAAAVFALPLAGLAWRRVRRLRREVA